jgi:hypothetical protein
LRCWAATVTAGGQPPCISRSEAFGRHRRQFLRRQWDHEIGAELPTFIRPMSERLRRWREVTGRHIELFVGDVVKDFLSSMVREFHA